MSYSVLWERRGAIITHLDRVTFHDFMEAVFSVHANENYQVIDYVIHDMIGVVDFDFSDVDMIKMVAHELGARFTNPNVRPAVVSTNSSMGEMTKVFNEMTKLDVGFFSTTQEAMTWVKKSH